MILRPASLTLTPSELIRLSAKGAQALFCPHWAASMLRGPRAVAHASTQLPPRGRPASPSACQTRQGARTSGGRPAPRPCLLHPRSAITENTRASYPIEHIPNARTPCVGPHPSNVILLCCDAFGVLPPVSRLTREQAMYHFVSGYTSKVRCARPHHAKSRLCSLEPAPGRLLLTGPPTGPLPQRYAFLAGHMNMEVQRVQANPTECQCTCCPAGLDPPGAATCGTGFSSTAPCCSAQVAGTEMGVTEPEATFSACYGGAFLM
jgi:hypothetical protein